MSAPRFHGIDFANRKATHRECWIADDGEQLVASFEPTSTKVARIAVDCPFGTTLAFSRLLRGEVAKNESIDVFKSRATERLLREVVSNYVLNRDWQACSKADRQRFSSTWFFHSHAHIQPAVGMVIVPELLAWLADRAGTATDARLSAMRSARLGEGLIVEAHPRLFLYSAAERLRRRRGLAFGVEELDAIAGYKGSGADAEARRQRVFDLLASDTSWLGPERRTLQVPDIRQLIATDHAFDAWLSALTAWAHSNGETWSWQDSGRLDIATVEIEGHILLLRTDDR